MGPVPPYVTLGESMPGKCSVCREEGHNRATCPDQGPTVFEDFNCQQCGRPFSATKGSGATFCSGPCFEHNKAGGVGSPWKPDPAPAPVPRTSL